MGKQFGAPTINGEIYLINPEIPTHFDAEGYTCIEEKAGVALPRLVRQL